MFVNKIGNGFRHQQTFRGYQHQVNNSGQKIMRFNYPFDYEHEKCEVEFYNVRPNPSNYSGYEIIGDKPVGRYPIGENGIEINIQDMTELNSDNVFAYRIIKNDQHKFADIGMQMNGFTLVTGHGTMPMVQGPGVLTMPDLHRPGAYYEKETGKVIYDITKQKEAEGTIRNFSNTLGGSLAGLEYDLDDLKSDNPNNPLKDAKIIFSTPIAGGDSRSAFRYWNKNNMQIDSGMGTAENYASFVKKLFQHGKKFVYDGTFTSEGLEGIHFQYAVRWADKNPQTYYWFRMTGLKDAPLGYGVVPKHIENLRHKVINAPSVYEPETGTVKKNPAYNPNKETLIQLYDASQVTDEQAADLEKPIDIYRKLKSGTPLDINTHDDTVISYVFEVNPKEYSKRLEVLSEHNKGNETPILQNSPEGTVLVAQFSNFKFIKKTDGGFVTWDANTDMAKMNYHISNYDEKILKSIVNPSQRDYETKMTVRGTYEVQDLALQAGRYWTGKSKKIQTLYTAQTLQGAATADAINSIIAKGDLPKEAELSEDSIQNIINEYYDLEPKGVMEKDDITVKALMSLPLDSLEFGENTVGILSTSFFSNRATSPETIGLSRFELMQKGDTHLVEPYANNYIKTNNLFKNELKNFADQIIQKVNETSSEKLLDENGNYTEYGEYVIEVLGQDIAKYALLKAVGGSNTKALIFEDGTITYDYDKIKENTTIKALGIHAHNPADEAEELRGIISKGLNKLNIEDVDFVAHSIAKRLSGTNTNSFRLAEAIVAKASLGLDWRLDAAKDVIDMDAVRNGDMSFDQAWDQVIDFWSKFVQAVKKENPNSYIVAEITDVEQLMKSIFGEKTNVYEEINKLSKYKSVKDAMLQFYLKTGIVSEAGYSYTFTNLLKIFSPDFENNETGDIQSFMKSFYELLNERGIDYIRNLWTFADNHDKPSVIHGMALDMNLFNAIMTDSPEDYLKNKYPHLEEPNNKGELDRKLNSLYYEPRKKMMAVLMNVDNYEDLPLEAKLNLYNMNYFRTASTKAIAMSKLMRDCISGLSNDVATEEEKKFLKEAATDLANGNYHGSGSNFELAIKTPELSSLRGALTAMLQEAGIYLESDKFNAILDIANRKIGAYAIKGDLKSSSNTDRIDLILRGENVDKPSGEKDLSKYSLYTVAIAGLLREAFHSAIPDVSNEDAKKFWEAQKTFVKKYDSTFVEAQQASLPFIEDSAISRRKDGYGARDFETVIKIIIEQAKYKAHPAGKLEESQHFKNTDRIILDLFKSSTEPAIKKAVIYSSILSGLPGIPTNFIRDMLGALGFDEKAKNIFLQNRNAVPWSELEEGPLKEYRQQILKMFLESVELRTLADKGLNNGTPYHATTDSNIPAIMMQDAYGNATVSLFNTAGISHDNRHKPEIQDREVEHILFGLGLAFPVGTIFKNIFDKKGQDEAEYVVKKIGDLYGIVKSGGGKINLNKVTSRNGVMILKRVSFKGNSRTFNKQYNFVSNPYRKTEAVQEGQKLSIISK